MNASFYSGVSGIKTHQFGINVWSNNIANVNTNGFRGYQPEFKNLFSQTLNNALSTPSFSQSGYGATTQTSSMIQDQGSLVTGERTFDMAIFGKGWFGTSGQDGQIYYTRDGSFAPNGNRDLVDASGKYVLGTSNPGLATGTITQRSNIKLSDVASQGKIHLPLDLTMPPTATTEVSFKGNLNPTAEVKTTNVDLTSQNYTSSVDTTNKTISLTGNVNNVTNLQNPQKGDTVNVTITDAKGVSKNISTTLAQDLSWNINSSDVSNLDLTGELTIKANIATKQEVANTAKYSTEVISPTGERNTLILNFTKRVPNSTYQNTWEVSATIQDRDKNTLSTSSGEIAFSETGGLRSNTLGSINNGGTALNIDLGTIGGGNGNFAGMTAVSSQKYDSPVIKKDGYVAGKLDSYSVNAKGQIYAHFDNQEDAQVARVAVYHFQNDQGLTLVGGKSYQYSANSGEPHFFDDATDSTKIVSKKLEASNVNLATALTQLIIMQKAFDASSKSITTSDALIQNAINLKR